MGSFAALLPARVVRDQLFLTLAFKVALLHLPRLLRMLRLLRGLLLAVLRQRLLRLWHRGLRRNEILGDLPVGGLLELTRLRLLLRRQGTIHAAMKAARGNDELGQGAGQTPELSQELPDAGHRLHGDGLHEAMLRAQQAEQDVRSLQIEGAVADAAHLHGLRSHGLHERLQGLRGSADDVELPTGHLLRGRGVTIAGPRPVC
mmetsp:Transcript_125288/g.350833  ORF Transcript_125288/g.350833 Transcript_125288/m.350833 type:complete len:203 (-) Transcript_125288:573-1181(-)